MARPVVFRDTSLMPDSPPDLSIVVPVLNEIEALPVFCELLAAQRGLDFELILCDGGSTDGTADWIRSRRERGPVPIRLAASRAGRARQLNAGVRLARATRLLFLHVDSRFTHPRALSRAVAAFDATLDHDGTMPLAGHFALRFDLPDAQRNLAYYFYEAKARSGRPGTVYGDQGFLLEAELFRRFGPFDEKFGLFEDSRFADRIFRGGGRWVLLPVELLTSARRFRTEGLRARQTLNALLVNFAVLGWDAFFDRAPGLYRQQKGARQLDLRPFFRLVAELLSELPAKERFRLWLRTGEFVRRQGWQVGLYLDCRRNRRAGHPPGTGPATWLECFERWYEPLTDHPPGRAAAAGLVWFWFRIMLRRLGTGHTVRNGSRA